MKRRELLHGMIAVPLVPMFRPDVLPVRKAGFEEVGAQVLLTLALPGLFRKGDEEAVASIDSGFDTTLEFHLRVWRWGTRERIADAEHLVKIRKDPWKKRYVVRAQISNGWAKREFETREAAIAAATTLQRVRLVGVSSLERAKASGGPYYFVEILALRNPLPRTAGRFGARPSERSGGRDLEWFARLVDVVAGERAIAEEAVHIRTNPFYLPRRG